MTVFWTLSAKRDRREIIEFVAEHDPSAALRLEERFLEVVKRLEAFPGSAPLGAVSGTREMIAHRSYRIVFEIRNGDTFVLAVVHTARQWPPVDP